MVGSSLLETLLAIVAGSILGPVVTALAKRISWIDEQLGAAINLGVTLALYLGAWWFATGGDRTALEQYLVWALAAAGVGGAGVNVLRKRVSRAGS